MNPSLSVLYSRDCCFWIRIFKVELKLGDSVHLQEECVEELRVPLKQSKIEELSRSRAIVVIITRGFLDFLETNHEIASSITGCLRPATTVALLLGVPECDVQRYSKTTLLTYHAWTRFVVNKGQRLPLEVARTITDMFGRPEGTHRAGQKHTAVKNTRSLDPLGGIEDTQVKSTIKNAKFSQSLERAYGIRKRTAATKNTESFQSSKITDDIRETKTIMGNTESSQELVETDSIPGEKTPAKNTESLPAPEKMDDVQKRKMTEKTSESFQSSRKTNDIQENKVVMKNVESSQWMVVTKNTESFQLLEITDDIQENKTIMSDAESSQVLEKTGGILGVKKPIENTKSLSASEKMDDIQKRNMAGKTAESFPLSRKANDIQENKVVMKNGESSPLLEKNVDMQCKKPAMKNTKPFQSVERIGDVKTDDIQGNKAVVMKNGESSQLLEKMDDTQVKSEIKNTKSSQASEKAHSIRKRRAATKNTESFQLLDITDDIQENKTIMRNAESSQVLEKTDGILGKKTPIKNTKSFPPPEKKKDIQKRKMAEKTAESFQLSRNGNDIQENKAVTKNGESPQLLEETDDIQHKKPAIRSTKSCQALEKTEDIRKKKTTMKNIWCVTTPPKNAESFQPLDKTDNIQETKAKIRKFCQVLEEKDNDRKGETTDKNTEFFQSLEKTGNIQEKKSPREKPIFCQWSEKTEEKKSPREKTISCEWLEKNQEKKTTMKNTESSQVLEKTDDIQENKAVMTNAESSKVVEKTHDYREKEKTMKNAKSCYALERMEDDLKSERTAKNTELFQWLEKIGSTRKKKTIEKTKSCQWFENTRDEKTIIKNTESSKVLEKTEDIQEETTIKNAKSPQALEKMIDVRKGKTITSNEKSCQVLDETEGIQDKKTTMKNKKPSHATGKAEDSKENNTAMKNAQSSPVLKKTDDMQPTDTQSYPLLKEKDHIQAKKTPMKRAQAFDLLENTDVQERTLMKNVESSQMLEKTDDVQERMAEKNTESFQILQKNVNTAEKQTSTEILMVPNTVDKDNDCVFLILTSLLNDIESIYVLLERNIIKEAVIHKMNPYVVVFSVPERFFEIEGPINVHIWYNNKLLAVKRLHIVASTPTSSDRGRLLSVATSPLDISSIDQYGDVETPCCEDDAAPSQLASQDEEEDQTCDDNDFSKADEDEIGDDTVPSFLKIWAEYRLDEWPGQFLLEDEKQDKTSMPEKSLDVDNHGAAENVVPRERLLSRSETSHRASFPSSTATLEVTTSELRRSESEPSLSGSFDETKSHSYDKVSSMEMEEDKYYMDMSKGSQNRARRPHELLLEELGRQTSISSRQSSFSSHVYVSMKLREEPQLSTSQQELLELLQAYKRGVKSLSEVENLFGEWHVKHQDSVDDREVVFQYTGNRAPKERKIDGLTDIVRLITRKSKKKQSKAKAQPQDAKARLKQQPKDFKAPERCDRVLSKISTSSVSSAGSTCSDASASPTVGNREGQRDSSNHSDSNEDNKNKAEINDKSTHWFLPLSPGCKKACSFRDGENPPSLPTRPPPSIQSPKSLLPGAPSRPPRKLQDCQLAAPEVPPKPANLLKMTNSPTKSSPPKKKKKSKSKSDETKPKKPQRDSSPDYITATNHPHSPPKTRGQFHQPVQCSPNQARRNNYVLGKLNLIIEPPHRKVSAPSFASESNTSFLHSTIPRGSVSPLAIQKEHHSRFRKALIPDARRSSSCPNFLEINKKRSRVSTYLELCRDSQYIPRECELQLASDDKRPQSIPDEDPPPPPLPPRP